MTHVQVETSIWTQLILVAELGSEDWQDEWSTWRMFSAGLWLRPIETSFQLSASPTAWIKVVGFINQTRYLVSIFSRESVFEALAGPHCARRNPPTSPKHGLQAVGLALRSSELRDTAVRINLCASLSPVAGSEHQECCWMTKDD